MCVPFKLKVGDNYLVDGFHAASIVEKEGIYYLGYNGVELEVRSIAFSPEGEKAALRVGSRKTKKGVSITPSPLIT